MTAKVIKPQLTWAQRTAMGIAHVIDGYRLGSTRTPEDIKWDFTCRVHDYLQQVVVGFDSDAFMKAAGYSDRVRNT